MSLEALQQSIIQRPNMVLAGQSRAVDEAQAQRLFDMAKQDRLVQGILQAMGLFAEQQRFGEQFGEQKRATQFNESMAANADFRAGRQLGMAEEEHGWDRSVRGDPAYQANQREMQLRELEGLGISNRSGELNNQFAEQTMQPRVAAVQGQADLIGMDVEQRGLMDPLAYDSAIEALNMSMAQRNRMHADAQWDSTQRGWQMADRPAQLEAQRAQGESQKLDLERSRAAADFEQRFRNAKTEDERNALVGSNWQLWSQFKLSEMDNKNRLAVAGVKEAVNPSEFAKSELNKLGLWATKAATTNVVDMIELKPGAAAQAAKLSNRIQDLVAGMDSGELAPREGESPESYFGRMFSSLDLSAEEFQLLLSAQQAVQAAPPAQRLQVDGSAPSRRVAPKPRD